MPEASAVKRQVNIALDDEAAALIEELLPAAKEYAGLPVKTRGLFFLALKALREKYVAAGVIRSKGKR